MKKFEKKTEFGTGRISLESFIESTVETPNYFDWSNKTVGGMAQQILTSHAEIDRKERVIRKLQKQLNSAKSVNITLRGDRKELLAKLAEPEALDASPGINKRAVQSFESTLRALGQAVNPKPETTLPPVVIGEHNLNDIGCPFSDHDYAVLETELAERLRVALRSQVPGPWTYCSERTRCDVPGIYRLYFMYGSEAYGRLRTTHDVAEQEKNTFFNADSWYQYLGPLDMPNADFFKNTPEKPQPIEVKVGKYQWGSEGRVCYILDVGQQYCLYRFEGSPLVNHRKIEVMKKAMQEDSATFIEEAADAE